MPFQGYEKLIDKYLHHLEQIPYNFYNDSSLVCNKLGEDKAEYSSKTLRS